MINIAVVTYVLYINCCLRHWTLTLGSLYSLLFTVYYSLYQSSFCCCQINHYCCFLVCSVMVVIRRPYWRISLSSSSDVCY